MRYACDVWRTPKLLPSLCSDKVKQSKAKQNKAKQSKAKQSKAKQSKAKCKKEENHFYLLTTLSCTTLAPLRPRYLPLTLAHAFTAFFALHCVAIPGELLGLQPSEKQVEAARSLPGRQSSRQSSRPSGSQAGSQAGSLRRSLRRRGVLLFFLVFNCFFAAPTSFFPSTPQPHTRWCCALCCQRAGFGAVFCLEKVFLFLPNRREPKAQAAGESKEKERKGDEASA